ncbi:sigma-54 interaction domain-containing protein [Telmatobacter bradus]|uniref:sigma-54 interaction domain-containing protein n=1 Tax=Telmatobacter bradus TaxID=474953 RepID=UPI003B428BC7
MQPAMVPNSPNQLTNRQHLRTALVASADHSFRQRLSQILSGLRWQVREAGSGAEAWAEAESAAPEAVIVDSWLPDLELNEFLDDFRIQFPQVDLVAAGSGSISESPRGPYRQELLYALRRSQDSDTASWNAAPTMEEVNAATNAASEAIRALPPISSHIPLPLAVALRPEVAGAQSDQALADRLPQLIGNAPVMLEVSRRIRLVAPRMTPVLIEGPTGSGKELVAEALHRLSPRSRKPFVAINCAAIPEALLEAELFGHTRGAFTGAVQGRVGRIESADGGTLFLDEIGEMPLALQSKLLRFVECGEIQRVGDNETIKVDVRILAATHRPLAQHAANGSFRSDLYYRLAVFLIRTPALADHLQDLPLLVEHFLEKMGRDTPVKRLDASALSKLGAHYWPGNVRELAHVLERAVILAGDAPQLTAAEVDFGLSIN